MIPDDLALKAMMVSPEIRMSAAVTARCTLRTTKALVANGRRWRNLAKCTDPWRRTRRRS